MIYNIHHLHCGTLCPLCGPLFGQRGMHAQVICHCLLLESRSQRDGVRHLNLMELMAADGDL